MELEEERRLLISTKSYKIHVLVVSLAMCQINLRQYPRRDSTTLIQLQTSLYRFMQLTNNSPCQLNEELAELSTS